MNGALKWSNAYNIKLIITKKDNKSNVVYTIV